MVGLGCSTLSAGYKQTAQEGEGREPAVVTLCLVFRVLQVPCRSTWFKKKSEPISTWLTPVNLPKVGCPLQSLYNHETL